MPQLNQVSNVFLLKGRSIDGACWYSGPSCWGDHPGLGTAFNTPEGVAGALAEAKWDYDHTSMEDCVGCLEIQTLTRSEYEAKRTEVYEQMEREAVLWDEEQG